MSPRNFEKVADNGDLVDISLLRDNDTSEDDIATTVFATSPQKSPLSRYVDVDMIPAKLTYLVWGGLIGTYIMYLNPFLESIGLAKDKAGLITGCGLGLASISGPLWGMLTDSTGSPKIIVTLICVASAGWVSSLPFIAAALPKQTFNELCTRHAKSVNGVETIRVNSTLQTANNSTQNCMTSYEDRLFYTFLVTMSFGSIFYLNVQNFIDTTALKTIKTSRKGATYGAQRIFGAIGATASIYLTAAVIDGYKVDGMSEFASAFFIFVPFVLICVPMSCVLIHQYQRNIQLDTAQCNEIEQSVKQCDNVDTSADDDADDIGVLEHLWGMFRQLDVIVFMTTALIAGMAFNLFIFFTMFLINEQLDVSITKAGFIFSGLNVANIVMFPFTGMIIRLLRGPKLAIVIGVVAHCVRNIVMSYTRTYWVMLAVQVLHCADFALLWSAMMEYVHQISPMKIRTTMIMILQSLHFGFSPFLMNIVGGVIYQQFDGKRLFRGVGLMSGGWAVLLSLYYGIQIYTKKSESKNEKESNDNNNDTTINFDPIVTLLK